MKKMLALAFVVIAITSCGKKEEKKQENLHPETTLTAEDQLISSGKELFDSSKAACATCHLPDKKVIGPSITEIAKVYKDQNASIFDFLRQRTEPIVDPSQYEVMKTNFAVIKTFSDEEIKSLEAYIMSL